MGICMHIDTVRCDNCAPETYPQAKPIGFPQCLESFKPNAMLRALGQVMQNGPCDIPNCFVCSGSVGGSAGR